MTDAVMARIARTLAVALSDFAYSRKDEDKKRVAALQYELCAAHRAELEDAARATAEPTQ